MSVNRQNLAYSTVAVAPTPAGSGTLLSVQPNTGKLFSPAPFRALACPEGVRPLPENAELVLVTERKGDELKIERAQGGTTAKQIAIGWQFFNAITEEDFAELEEAAGKVRGTATLTSEATLEWGKAYRANAAGSSFNLNMPPATGNNDQVLYIKITAGSGTNTVTLIPHGSEQFNGEEAALVLSAESTIPLMLVAMNNNPEVF